MECCLVFVRDSALVWSDLASAGQVALIDMDKLPAAVEADALRTLAWIDVALGELVQAIGESRRCDG